MNKNVVGKNNLRPRFYGVVSRWSRIVRRFPERIVDN